MKPEDATDSLRASDEIFEHALALEGEERQRYLDTACGDSPDLRERVESLLAAVESEGRLRRGGAFSRGLFESLGEESRVGSQIGAYELVEVLGQGGMGVVYRAERVDGDFHQTVAIKLLRPGSHSGALVRFTQERQILAALDHPNIARLLDGGVTDLGEPYLVVEFVEGVQLDEYCAAQTPSIRERLRLISSLCAAVDEAHRRLIIHRDIKPSNVLVTADGIPKLLDFGIAKLLEQDPSSNQTATRDQVMTLQYASPEQYHGSPVTVASDVYQLGLVAYEVLTGHKPYSLRNTPPSTAERLIVAQDPPIPSSQVEHGPTRKLLRGDLDTILLKALRKEAEQRYSSARAMADDIERFLGGFPVRARRATWTYRAGKFLRRNPLAAGLIALLLATVAAFTVRVLEEQERTRQALLEAQSGRAQAEGALAETQEVLDFMVDLFGEVTPDATAGEPVAVIDLLDAARESLEQDQESANLTRARLTSRLGSLYRLHGHLESATELQDQALAVLEASPDDSSGDNSRHDELRGTILHEQGKAVLEGGSEGDPLSLYQEALEAIDRWDPRSKLRGYVTTSLAVGQVRAADFESALQSARQAVSILLEHLDEDDIDILSAQRVAGDALVRLGRFQEAREHLEPIVAALREAAPESGALLGALNALALAEERLGNVRASVALHREAEVIARTLYQPGHVAWFASLGNLGNALKASGANQEAEGILLEVADQAAKSGNNHAEASARTGLGLVYVAVRRGDEAIAEFLRVQQLNRARLPDGHASHALAANNLGTALQQVGRRDEAEAAFEEAVRIGETALGQRHFYLGFPLLNLSALAGHRGEHAAAEAFARRAFLIFDASQALDGRERLSTLEVVITALEYQGRYEEAKDFERYRTARFEEADGSTAEASEAPPR